MRNRSQETSLPGPRAGTTSRPRCGQPSPQKPAVATRALCGYAVRQTWAHGFAAGAGRNAGRGTGGSGGGGSNFGRRFGILSMFALSSVTLMAGTAHAAAKNAKSEVRWCVPFTISQRQRPDCKLLRRSRAVRCASRPVRLCLRPARRRAQQASAIDWRSSGSVALYCRFVARTGQAP